MVKLLFVLLGSFWLSCGNTPGAVQKKTVSSNEKTETILITSDTLLKDDMNAPYEEIDATEEPAEVVAVEKEELSEPIAPLVENQKVAETVNSKPDHSLWSILLDTYVNDKGDVDYKNLRGDMPVLEDYLTHLEESGPEKDWSKNEKLAYYINLYNAATIKLILDKYPIKSIKDIKNPWGAARVKIGDSRISLGDIEHKILRKMNEPRIHFAINCASSSCPKLLNKAFTASQMEAQLNTVTLDFINDDTRNRISKEKMQLSNIFKWYKKDFTENGSLTDYIKPYTEVEINSDADIDYLKYDWSLNEAN